MKKKNKIDAKRIIIVILFSVLMILWLFKGPIKSVFKTKKEKNATERINSNTQSKSISLIGTILV